MNNLNSTPPRPILNPIFPTTPVKALQRLDNRVAIWDLSDRATRAPLVPLALLAAEENIELIRQTLKDLRLRSGSEFSLASDRSDAEDQEHLETSKEGSLTFPPEDSLIPRRAKMAIYKIQVFDGTSRNQDSAEDFIEVLEHSVRKEYAHELTKYPRLRSRVIQSSDLTEEEQEVAESTKDDLRIAFQQNITGEAESCFISSGLHREETGSP